METREVLLKADKVVLVIERISDGKIRVTTTSWDDAKVILPNQVLEVATIGKQVGLVRVESRSLTWTSTTPVWSRPVTVRVTV